MLDTKSDKLDPEILKRLPQQPVASALGTEPTEEEIATAMKVMEGRVHCRTSQERRQDGVRELPRHLIARVTRG